MSRSDEAARMVGPELASVQRSLRVTVVAMASIATCVTVFLAITQFETFPIKQLLITLACIPLVIAALVLRFRAASGWLAIITIVLLAESAEFSDPLSDARLSASNLLFIACAFGVVMLRGPLQFAWIAAITYVWLHIVPSVPLPSTLLGAEVDLRWSVFVQLVVSGVFVLFAWNREYANILVRDAATVRAEREASASALLRQRLKVWRDSRMRIHETLLNDIRSILDGRSVDQDGLIEQLRVSEGEGPPLSPTYRLRDAVDWVVSSSAPGQRVVIGLVTDADLPAERTQPLRGAMLEIVRNMFRHSGCNEVTIDAAMHGDECRITITPDAAKVSATNQPLGMGVGVVLREALASAGASMERQGEGVLLRLRPATLEVAADDLGRPAAGRVIVSGFAAGNALGGFASFVALLSGFGIVGLAAAASAIVTTLIAVTVTWRGIPSRPAYLVISAATATATPLLVSQMVNGCSNVELLIMAASLSSMALGAVIAWTPSMRWWWLALGCVVAMLQLTQVTRGVCESSVNPALLNVLLTPGILATVWITLQRATRREAKLRAMRIMSIEEAAAAAAARDVNQELHGAVTRARNLLQATAYAGAVSDARRWSLRCVDAELRATIQVDPESAGGFALATVELVRRTVSAGVPLRVLAIRGTGTRTALPEEIFDVLRRIALVRKEEEASVQLLSTGSEDTLVLMTSADAIERAGFASGYTLAVDGATLQIDGEDEPATVIVSRGSAAA